MSDVILPKSGEVNFPLETAPSLKMAFFYGWSASVVNLTEPIMILDEALRLAQQRLSDIIGEFTPDDLPHFQQLKFKITAAS